MIMGGAHAALAQLVEHIIRNDGATGSSPVSGTTPPKIAILTNAMGRGGQSIGQALAISARERQFGTQ